MKRIMSVPILGVSFVLFGCGQSATSGQRLSSVQVSSQQPSAPKTPDKIAKFDGSISNAFVDASDAEKVNAYLFDTHLIASRSQFYAKAKSSAQTKLIRTVSYQDASFDIIEKDGQRMLLVDDGLIADLGIELRRASDPFTLFTENDGRCASAVIGAAINGAISGAAGGAVAGAAIGAAGGPASAAAGAAAGAAVGGSAGAVGGALSSYGNSPACSEGEGGRGEGEGGEGGGGE